MGKWWVVNCSGRVRPCRRGGRKVPKGSGFFLVQRGRKWVRFDYHPFAPLWLSAVMPAGGSPLDQSRYSLYTGVHPMKKKTKAKSDEDAPHLAPVETEHLHGLMQLVEHCCCRQYEDGDPRETGWFTVQTVGAQWKVSVKDPDSGMSFSVMSDTLDQALESAALLLACDEAPWMDDPWLKSRKASKGRK